MKLNFTLITILHFFSSEERILILMSNATIWQGQKKRLSLLCMVLDQLQWSYKPNSWHIMIIFRYGPNMARGAIKGYDYL